MDRGKPPEFDDSLEGAGITPEPFGESPAPVDDATEEYTLDNANTGYTYRRLEVERRSGILVAAARAIREYRPGGRMATFAAVVALGGVVTALSGGGDRVPGRDNAMELDTKPPTFHPGDRPIALKRAPDEPARKSRGDSSETHQRTTRKRNKRAETPRAKATPPARVASVAPSVPQSAVRQQSAPTRSKKAEITNPNKSSKSGNKRRRKQLPDIVDNSPDAAPITLPDGSVLIPEERQYPTGGATANTGQTSSGGGTEFVCADGRPQPCQGNVSIAPEGGAISSGK